MTVLYGRNAQALRDLFETDASHRPIGTQWTKLPPIWSGGLTDCPEIALVFINPTYRNQSASPHWPGDRAPFIGLKRTWSFLSSCGLLESCIVEALPNDQAWSTEDASRLYKAISESSLYVTNLVKACGVNSDLPSLAQARNYLNLMTSELAIVRPRYVVTMGSLVSSLLLGRTMSLGLSFNHVETTGQALVAGAIGESMIVPSYFPVGRGSPTRARAIISALHRQSVSINCAC
jgi:hypothetical protein